MLWDAILAAAGSTRSTPRARVVVAGPPSSGKSTVLSALSHFDVLHQQMEPVDGLESQPLGYVYCDVFEDSGDVEDPVAIVEGYELHSDPTMASTLISFALARDQWAQSVVVLCLDWSKPWDFVLNLESYLTLLIKETASMTAGECESSEDLKAQLERSIREYKEPDASGNTPKPISSTLDATISAHNVTLPLGQGILTTNLGIPIIVVCCKADSMIALEREKGYGDGTFDYIQQALRTICLKYGASLFYTSIFKPQTLATLRQYILHQVLRNTDSASLFPFTHRAQVIDREVVCVPAGWDNWGLIRVQGGGFRCEALAGWEFDDEGENEGEGESVVDGEIVALRRGRRVYESEIRNIETEKTVSKPLVMADEEQVFLERNLELIGSTSTGNASGTASPFQSSAAVGPDLFAQRLASAAAGSNSPGLSSSDMMEDVSQKLAKLAKLKEQSTSASFRSKLSNSEAPASPSRSTIAASISSPNPIPAAATKKAATTTSDNEVLSSFFQSLLNKKSTTSGGGGSGGVNPSPGSMARSLTAKSGGSGGSPVLTAAEMLKGGGGSVAGKTGTSPVVPPGSMAGVEKDAKND